MNSTEETKLTSNQFRCVQKVSKQRTIHLLIKSLDIYIYIYIYIIYINKIYFFMII